jgi:hypothetical protein
MSGVEVGKGASGTDCIAANCELTVGKPVAGLIPPTANEGSTPIA